MDTPAPGGTPPATVTPAAAQPAASSSTVQQPADFNSRVASATSRGDIRNLVKEMAASLPKPGAAQPKPAQVPAQEAAPAAEAPAAEPEAAAPAASEETQATPEAGTEQAEGTAAPEDQDQAQDQEEDGGEGPVTPLSGKRAHIRIPDSEVDKLALAYQRRNRDWTLEQSLEAAKKQLGITTQKPEVVAEKAPESNLPATPAETQSAISQKLVAYKKAMAEVRFEDAADIQAEILQLQEHRSTLERRAEQEQTRAEQQYHADFDASVAKAVDLYPFAADATSPGGKRMAQIEAVLKANKDPLYHSPDKPLKLAQMVAAELNIAPRNKNAAPAKPAAAPVTNGAPKKGVVPSGSSRTTPPAQNQPAVDPAIAGIKTMTDLRAQLRRLGVK